MNIPIENSQFPRAVLDSAATQGNFLNKTNSASKFSFQIQDQSNRRKIQDQPKLNDPKILEKTKRPQ